MNLACSGKLLVTAVLAVLSTQQLEPQSQLLESQIQPHGHNDRLGRSGSGYGAASSSSVTGSDSSSGTAGGSGGSSGGARIDRVCGLAARQTLRRRTAELCDPITLSAVSLDGSSVIRNCSASNGSAAAACDTAIGTGNGLSRGASLDGGRALGTAIPLTYFGLTVNHDETVPFPHLPFGAIRSWDATGVSWDDINTSAGTYNWSGFDAWISYVAGRNVDILYTFGRTPRWASSKPSAHTGYGPGQCAAPLKLSDWDDFVSALVKRAAGRIKYWELWNEPQDVTMYCGTIPQMVTMARHAYGIIKAADPSFQVVTPATLYDNGAGPAWLDTYLADGGTTYTDAVSFHGYLNAPAEDHLGVIRDYQAVTLKYSLNSKPLWNTESDWGNTKGAADQAAYLVKYYLVQWGAGLSRFYWYAYDNARYGTLYSKGSINQQGTAFRQVSSWMVGATQSQPCAEDSRSTWTCGFTRGGGYHALAVWNSARTVTYKPEPQYQDYRDLAGVSHTISGAVTVGNPPILLETGIP